MSLQSDIWSMGCILYELSTLRHAFEAPNLRALISKVRGRLVDAGQAALSHASHAGDVEHGGACRTGWWL
jgi:serine/threonine protein kinase